MRITTIEGHLLALKFDSVDIFSNFKDELKANSVSTSEIDHNNTTDFPDLEQPFVQVLIFFSLNKFRFWYLRLYKSYIKEYILRLLFSDNFSEFVDDLESLVESFQTRLCGSVSRGT